MSAMTFAEPITDTAAITTLTTTSWIIGIALYVLSVVALWRVFSKAGYPGVLAIIPIVNLFILVKVAGYSAWLTLLYIIPIVDIVFSIMVAFRIGRAFGKGGVFSFFLLWLPALQFIGYMILGFGRATYEADLTRRLGIDPLPAPEGRVESREGVLWLRTITVTTVSAMPARAASGPSSATSSPRASTSRPRRPGSR